MGGATGSRGRRLVAGSAFVAAAAAAVVQVVEGPPGSGYGWGSVLVSAVLVAGPLVVIGLLVRTVERRRPWLVVVLAVGMAALVLLALVGNWSLQSTTDRVLDACVAVLVLVACCGAVVVEATDLRGARGNRLDARGRSGRR